jgi:hypothetical protein
MTSNWGGHPTHSWNEGGKKRCVSGDDDDDNHRGQWEEEVDNEPGGKIGNNHQHGNAELLLKPYLIMTTCKMHDNY